MTRPVPDMMGSVPPSLDELDRRLLRLAGCGLNQLACDATGISGAELERCRLKVGSPHHQRGRRDIGVLWVT